ncbi:hypothetical protein AB0N09_21860 [Streptomyces erythrochromogenes]|uniref:hypothetical protein n=1 Tax=Streptomyces erythrochromogenes TaxID=285574 RepID=UPI00343A59A4
MNATPPPPSAFEVVNGPREAYAEDVITGALVANVALARGRALAGDARGEALYHREINKLLDLREAEEAGG